MRLFAAVRLCVLLLLALPPAFISALIAPTDALSSPSEDTFRCYTKCTDALDDCINTMGCDDADNDEDDDSLDDFWKEHLHAKCLENCWNFADACNQDCLDNLTSTAEVA